MSDVTLREPYPTDDTSLAAYLYTEGFKIIDIDYESERAKILFEEDCPEIRDLVRNYYIAKGRVDASTYLRNYKRLASVIRRKLPWVDGVVNR